MQKIKDFIISNYSEIFAVFSLFIIFFFLLFNLGQYMGNVIIDCGREAFLSEQVFNGKVLYRDIFNNYGPLGYQINAVFYRVFGVNLNSLRLAGVLNSLIIIPLLYFLLRLFTSKAISWAATVFIMTTCFFTTYLFNYIFPYSYSFIYSFSTFLFSVLFLILYFKTSKQKFIPLSWFFLGISIISKYEYILYVVFLALVMVFLKIYKKIGFKCILYSISAFLIIPLISLSVLFIQGLTFTELCEQTKLIGKFSLSPSLNYFYAVWTGLYPSKGNLILDLKTFVKVFPILGFLLTAIYFCLKKTRLSLNLIFLGVLFCILFPQILKQPLLIFSPLPLLTLVVFGYMFTKLLKEQKYSYEISYLTFLVMAFIVAIELYLFTNFSFYIAICAFNVFLLSVSFLLLYLKTSKQVFASLNWVFLGLAVVLKWEIFIPWIFFSMLVIFIKSGKKISIKQVLFDIVSFLIFPLIGLLLFMSKGLTISGLLNQSHIIKNIIFSTHNYIYLYSMELYLKTGYPLSIFDFLKQILIKQINFILILLGLIYYFLKIDKINFENFNKWVLSISAIGIFAYFNTAFSLIRPLKDFPWLALFTVFIFGIVLIRLRKNKNYLYDGLYLVLLVSTIVAGAKSIFFLNMHNFGVFALPLLIIANSIFIVEYLPFWFQSIDKDRLKKAFLIVILGLTISQFQNLISNFGKFDNIKSRKGNVSDTKNVIISTKQAINYIQKNLKPNDSIWIIPEGVMINFLTNHPTNGIYYSVMVPYIETFGEDKIISDTEKNSPDYIIINSRYSLDLGRTYICKDYGLKICKYIKSSYIQVAEFGKDYKMILYKRK